MTPAETLALIDRIRDDLCESKRYIDSHPGEYHRLIEKFVAGLGLLDEADLIFEGERRFIHGIVDLGWQAHRVYPEAYPGAVALVCWVLGQLRERVERSQ